MLFRVKQSVQLTACMIVLVGSHATAAGLQAGDISVTHAPRVTILSAPAITTPQVQPQVQQQHTPNVKIGTGYAQYMDAVVPESAAGAALMHPREGSRKTTIDGPHRRTSLDISIASPSAAVVPSPATLTVPASVGARAAMPAMAMIQNATPLAAPATMPKPQLGAYTSALIGGSVDWGVVGLYSMLGTVALASHNWDTDKKSNPAQFGFDYITTPASHETSEYNAQAGLGAVNASDAFARGFTGTGVTVSVVDSPFDVDHPDLAPALVTGYNARTGTTDVGSCTQLGLIVADSGCEAGFRNHGTHVAGIIAAQKGDGSSGMHGLAYEAKVKPISFLLGSGSFTYSGIFGAASGDGIIASNNSWGMVAGYYGQQYSNQRFKVPSTAAVDSQYAQAVSDAADDDTVIVFAAGNDGWNAETGIVDLYDNVTDTVVGTESASVLAGTFAGLSSNMLDTTTALISNMADASSLTIDADNAQYRYLVVASLDPATDRISTFSNGCGEARAYCLTAPGTAIYSTVDGGGYAAYNGTSMAAPHVTAAIALLRQNWPNLEPEMIVEILLKSAVDKGAAGVDEVYGHGLLDLKAATGPLGDLNLAPWPGSAMSPSALGGSNLGMVTPSSFGDMLASSNVEASALDSYERVFAVRVAVTPTTQKAMDVAAMMDTALNPADDARQIKISDASAFTVAVDNAADIQRASLQFEQTLPNQTIRAGYVDHRVTTDTQSPLAGGFDDDYTSYFYGMEADTQITKSVHFGSEVTAPVLDGGSKRIATKVRFGRTQAGDERLQSASTFGVSRNGYHLDATIGAVRESNGILGGTPTGALALAGPTSTLFGRIDAAWALSTATTLSGYYTRGHTKVRFRNADLASLDGLTTDSYGVKMQHQLGQGADASNGPTLVLSAWRPTAVTAGTFTINTIAGYNNDGSLRRGQFSYGLSPKRETAFQAELQQASGDRSKLALSVFHRINAGNVDGAEDTGAFIVSRQAL